MKIRFIRFNDNAVIPVRKHYSDTGADIPMMSAGSIQPHETIVIPLGFGIEVPNGHSARLQVRTSIAKQGVMIQGCAIDAGYTGEISMILHNISNKEFIWNKGERLGYIEVYPTQYPEFVENLEKGRGNGAFGSTGK
jgi:dUTP pyrophosphatase